MAYPLANRAQITPITTNAAASCGKPNVLVPQPDNTLKAVRRFIQEAGDWQSRDVPPFDNTGVDGMNQCRLI